MTTIDLKKIDEVILKQIVKKFSATSGSRFYRSCREAKELVEFVKPVWPLQKVRLTYTKRKREVRSFRSGMWKTLGSATVSPPFCKIWELSVDSCRADYLQNVVLPEVRALAAVRVLELGPAPEEHVRLLLEAAKPEAVNLSHKNHDLKADVFKNVKKLYIATFRDRAISKIYATTNILFDLAKGRDTILLHTSTCSFKKTAERFLKQWLNGKSTGTLKELTVCPVSSMMRAPAPSDEKRAFQRLIAKLVKSEDSTRDSYTVERGPDRLRICLSELKQLCPSVHQSVHSHSHLTPVRLRHVVDSAQTQTHQEVIQSRNQGEHGLDGFQRGTDVGSHLRFTEPIQDFKSILAWHLVSPVGYSSLPVYKSNVGEGVPGGCVAFYQSSPPPLDPDSTAAAEKPKNWSSSSSPFGLQDVRLTYTKDNREVKSFRSGGWKTFDSATVSPPFCKIDEVAVDSCSDDYLQTVVLPEVKALAAVRVLELGPAPEEHVWLLLEAAKPEGVSLSHKEHDARAGVFKNVRKLYISIYRDSAISKIYATTNILFDLAKGRDTIALYTSTTSFKKIVERFLKQWLNGKPTGTLKELTVCQVSTMMSALLLQTLQTPSNEKRALQRLIAKLVKSEDSTRNSYSVERGPDRLHICLTGNNLLRIYFNFS